MNQQMVDQQNDSVNASTLIGRLRAHPVTGSSEEEDASWQMVYLPPGRLLCLRKGRRRIPIHCLSFNVREVIEDRESH